MEYQYNCQEFLAIRKEKIIPIPENCIIAKIRLFGLSNDEFISAFRELQETAATIYDDAIKDPEAWGYPLEPYVIVPENYCGPRGVRYERLPDVLSALFTEGKMTDKILQVDIDAFKNKVKKHKKYNLVLKKLTEFGFEISGFEKGSMKYTVSFPDNGNLIVVLNSYIQSAEELLANVKPTYRCGMLALIGCFFYRFIEDKQYQKYDMIFHIMTDTFTEEYRDMCMALYDRALQKGHSYFPYYNDCYHNIDFHDYLGLGINYITKEVYSKIKLHKLISPEMIDKLYNLPERLQESFRYTTCSFCGGIGAPGVGNTPNADGSCKLRIIYNWHGETIYGCAYRSFIFKNIGMNDLPYLIDIFESEFTEK
jgi:hypothetical protein